MTNIGLNQCWSIPDSKGDLSVLVCNILKKVSSSLVLVLFFQVWDLNLILFFFGFKGWFQFQFFFHFQIKSVLVIEIWQFFTLKKLKSAELGPIFSTKSFCKCRNYIFQVTER